MSYVSFSLTKILIKQKDAILEQNAKFTVTSSIAKHNIDVKEDHHLITCSIIKIVKKLKIHEEKEMNLWIS